MAILRLLVAGVFTFLYTRQIGLRFGSALLSMFTFTFSGPLVSWLGFPPAHVIVWLPALFLCTEKVVASPLAARRWLAASAVVVGLQFLGGQPEVSFQVLLAWVAYTLFRTLGAPDKRLRHAWRALCWLLAAGLLGALLAAVQLAPFIEALEHSVIFADRQSETFQGVAVLLRRIMADWREWPALLLALLPHFFGTEQDNSYWFPSSNSIELSLYAGLLPLLLALAVAWQAVRQPAHPQRGLILFFTLFAVVSLALAVRLPLFNAINQLPLFNIALPGRLRLVYVFGVAVLAGFGFQAWQNQTPGYQRLVLRLLALAALATVVLNGAAYAGFTFFADRLIANGQAFMAANIGTPYFDRSLAYYENLVLERQALKLALYRPGNVVMYLPVLIAASVWIFTRWRRARSPSIGMGAPLVGLVLLDLFAVNAGFNTTTPRQLLYPLPGALAYLQRDRSIFRISGDGLALNPNTSMLYGLADIRSYDAMLPRRYANLLRQMDGFSPVGHH
ncbi:MAG: hypothetical protein ACRD6I_17340, partial [Candidatus Acidiferrales bacterium]